MLGGFEAKIWGFNPYLYYRREISRTGHFVGKCEAGPESGPASQFPLGSAQSD